MPVSRSLITLIEEKVHDYPFQSTIEVGSVRIDGVMVRCRDADMMSIQSKEVREGTAGTR